MSLSAAGVLSTPSTPTAACVGVYSNIVFSMNDSGTPTALTATSSAQTITVTGPTITFSSTLPAGAVGAAYAGSVAASGALGTATYSLASGALPASGDLVLNAGTGAITGSPKAADAGTYTFTVKVTDQYGDTATSGSLSITITAPTLTFPGSLAGGTVGTAYSASAAATGVLGTTTYVLASGSLPASNDLVLNATTGAITGTPHAADVGTYPITVKVTDQYGDTATSGPLSIAITAPTITFPSSLGGGTVGTAYSASAAATGALGTTTYVLASGSLPASNDLVLNATTGAITGTPHAADVGTYPITVKVTDQYGDTATSGALSITITAPTLTFPASLAGATVGTAYSASAAASGTVGTTTYSLASGSLGSHLTLNTSTGAITGTPYAADAGTFTFKVSVTDQYNDTATSGNLSITVTAPTITFATPTATANVGVAYSSSAGASGTVGTTTYSLASGSLGSHLTLNTSTGAITGTPYAADAGTYPFTVKVTDQYGDTATSGQLSITITAPTITFATPTATASVGVAYSSSAAATGPVGTTTYVLASGSLGSHLTLNPNTGLITGTPYAADAGTFTFKVSVTDQYNDTATSGNLSITVTAPTITFATPTATANVGVAYSSSAAASGTVGTTTYSLASGSLGSHLTLNPNTGLITGTPYAADAGTHNFSVSVTDQYNDTATSGGLSINVIAPTITLNTNLPAATVGSSYTGGVTASGTVGTTTYALTGGALSTSGHLALNTSTGAITGTPYATDTGTSIFAITVTDQYGDLAGPFTENLVINAAGAITFGAAPTDTATDGVKYSSAVTASGGAGTLTYSLVSSGSSNLPSDFALNSSTGAVSGTPESLSSFTFEVQAADAYGDTSATQSYTVTVSPGAGSKLVFTGEPSSTGTAATPFGAVVQIEDVNGFLVTSSTASVTITSPASVTGTTTVSALGGVATFTNLILNTSGAYTLTAASSGLSSAISSGITIGAGTATKLVFTTEPPTGGAAGAPFSATVQVQDAYGNLVTSSNASVAISSTASGVTGTLAVSAVGGVATFTNLILNTSGTYTLTAASSGLSSATSSNITIGAGIPSKVVFTTNPPASATAGTPFSAAAQIEDGNGNLVTGSTASVTISSTASGVTGTLTVSAVGGVATFTNLILNTTGTYTLTAASSGLTSGNSTSILIGAGTASKLVFTTQPPSGGTAATPFGAVVQVQDTYGNLVTSSGASVTITSPASVTGTTTVSAVGGVATFTNLILNTSGAYTLTAASSGLSSANSSSITIGAGAASQLAFTTEPPANVADGTAFTAVIQVQDANNNLVTTNNTASVTITTTAPGVSGTTTVVATGGVANFTNLILGTSGPYTLTAAATGLASANSTTVTASNALTINAATPPAADVGSAYSYTLTASGGSGGGYQFTTTGSNNLSTYGLTLASNGLLSTATTVTGTSGGFITFTAKVTDSASNSTTQAFSIPVYNGLSLPSPDPGSLPSTGYTNQTYNGSITGTGGTGTYQWSVDGTVVTGAGVSLGNGTLNATVSGGGNILNINGAPTTATPSGSPLTFSVTLTDTAANNVAITQTGYNIAISAPIAVTLPTPSTSVPGSAVANQSYTGQIMAINGVGPYTWSINGATIGSSCYSLGNGTLCATSSGGNTLSFSGTPSSAGAVTLTNVLVTDSTLPTNTSASNNYSINVVNPNVGYSVSGTVIYTGSKTGWVYLELSPNSGCGGCNQVLGTAINATTANSLLSPGLPFTIHGVPIGTYTLKAWMDNLGYGTPNASNPTRNVTGLTVTSSGLSGQSVTLADPSAVSLGTLTPAWDPNFGLGVFNGGAVVSFDPICSGSGCNNGGLEMPTRYNLEYSTDPTFNSGFNHQFFPADGGNSPWVVTGLTNGQTYYFRAAGWVGSTGGTNTAAEPSGGLLIGAPSTGSLLSGTVTFTLPTGVSASGKTLYAGCYASATGTIYADPITSPVSPQFYSVYVPNGTNCVIFGFIDLNNSGLIGGAGEIANTNGNGGAMVSVTVPNGGISQNITLPSGNSVAIVETQTNSGGGGGTGYGIGFQVAGLYKLPVAVELLSPETPEVSGTPADVVLPADIATGAFNGSSDFFDYWPPVTGTPVVGDSYSFNVTYSDGTSETLTAAVTGVLSAFATNLSPTGTGVSLTPNFSWDYPSSASSYLYQFQLNDNSGDTVWQIPQKHSTSSGFASTIPPFITWDVDPTNTGDLPSSSYLSNGGLLASTNYNWSIATYDSFGTEAQTQANFTTATSDLTLPASGPGPALAGYAFTGQITASGGSGSGVFTVNGTTIPQTGIGNAVSFTGNDGLQAYSTGSNTLYIVGTPTTAGNVSLTVSVIDSFSDTANQTYTLVVSSGPGTTGAHNSLLSGTYVCKFDGYNDSDGSRWTSLSSFVANGSGGISSGVWDMNSRDYSAAYGGTIASSSTYSVGADNMGVMTMHTTQTVGGTGTNTNTFAIAVNDANGATSTATEFRMVESDDVGASPTNQHGTGDCYLASTSAFALSTFNGGLVFSQNGESGSGVPEGSLILLSASSGTVNSGYADQLKAGSADSNLTFTGGSFSTPDSTYGRSTLTLNASGGSGTFAVYLIDANRGFVLEISDQKAQSGDLRKQQQSSYSDANLSGPAVFYNQEYFWNTGSNTAFGYKGEINQVSFNSAGTMTLNADYSDINGTYQANTETGATGTFTFDSSNPGRATVPFGGSEIGYFYFFDHNSALYMSSTFAGGDLASGWLEPQTQTTFTDAAVAGNYMFGMLPVLEPTTSIPIGEISQLSNGTFSGDVTLGGQGSFSYDQSIASTTYAWDTTAPNTGSFLEGSGSSGTSCIVISSTKDACIINTDNPPSVMILQQ
jgi:hypothetical protein